MTSNIHPFHENAAQTPSLRERHIKFCAEDIMRLADLMLAGKEHRALARHAVFARRYNHEYFPDPAMDVEALYQDDIKGVARNFPEQFRDIQRVPRLPANKPDLRGEMTYRVLSDSSPYLDNVVKWMERNRDTNGFDKYRCLDSAIRLLTDSHLVNLRSEEQLRALIEQGVTKVRNQPLIAATVAPPLGKPGVA